MGRMIITSPEIERRIFGTTTSTTIAIVHIALPLILIFDAGIGIVYYIEGSLGHDDVHIVNKKSPACLSLVPIIPCPPSILSVLIADTLTMSIALI